SRAFSATPLASLATASANAIATTESRITAESERHHRFDATPGQALASSQEIERHQEADSHDSRAGPLDEVARGARRPAGCNHVVNHEHAHVRGGAVCVHLEPVCAVLE